MKFRDPVTQIEIELSKSVSALLSQNRQKGFWSRERGGLLFASAGKDEIVRVCEATPPHPRDTCYRARLALDVSRCHQEIKEANDRGLWFVGYWHTHPERYPHISGDDITAFSANLRSPRIGITALLAIIVGTTGRPEEFSGFLVRHDRISKLV